MEGEGSGGGRRAGGRQETRGDDKWRDRGAKMAGWARVETGAGGVRRKPRVQPGRRPMAMSREGGRSHGGEAFSDTMGMDNGNRAKGSEDRGSPVEP